MIWRRTGVVAFIFLALFLVRGLLATISHRDSGWVPLAAADPASGPATALDQEGWTTSQCRGCHGRDGEGTARAPALAGTKLTAEVFGKIVREGRGKMPEYDTDDLPDDQLQHLYIYLHSLSSPSATPTATGAATVKPTEAAVKVTAAQAWKEAACGGCHGASAGGGSAPPLAATNLTTAEFARVVRVGRRKMPAYDADELPQDRLELVYRYVRGLTAAPRPRPVPHLGGTRRPAVVRVSAQEAWSACGGCHGASGEGGAGPALAGTGLTEEGFFNVVRSGRRQMPAYTSTELPTTTLSAIYTFMHSRKATSVPPFQHPAARPAPPMPVGPRQVAQTQVAAPPTWTTACAGCHGAAATGGMGPALKGTGLSVGEFARIVRLGQGRMPAIPASMVPDSDLSRMYVFVHGGSPVAMPVTPLPGPISSPTTGAPASTPGTSGQVVAPPSWISCAGCHGAAGMGASGPRLTGTKLAPGEFTTIVRQGKGKMPPFASSSLPDVDIKAIYAFCRSAHPGAAPGSTRPISPGTAPPGTLRIAAPNLWTQTSCAGCHGPTAMGGMGPPLASLQSSYESFETIVRKGKGQMPGTPTSELSESDLHKLYDFLHKSKVDVTALSLADRLQAWLTRRHVGLGLALIILLSGLLSVRRLGQSMNAAGWRRLKPHLKKLGSGRVASAFLGAIVLDGLLVRSLWRRSPFLWLMHALMLYGLLALALAALGTMLRPVPPGALPFLPTLHALAGLAAVVVLVGILFVRYRYSTDPYTDPDTPNYESKYVVGRDYMALTMLTTALLSAMLLQLLQDVGQRALVIPGYLIYLAAIAVLLLAAPFTGLAHAFIAPFYSALLKLAGQVTAQEGGATLESGSSAGGSAAAGSTAHAEAAAREAARMLRAIDPQAQEEIDFLLPQFAARPQ